jgi:predicted component of type VI protein secretion system
MSSDPTESSSSPPPDFGLENAKVAQATAKLLHSTIEGLYVLMDERHRKHMNLLMFAQQSPDLLNFLVSSEQRFDKDVTQTMPLLIEKCKQLVLKADSLVAKASVEVAAVKEESERKLN